MTEERFNSICVTGVTVLIVMLTFGLIAASTHSYWSFHGELLKRGKIKAWVEGHYELKDAPVPATKNDAAGS